MPRADQRNAVRDNFRQGAVGIDHRISVFGERIAQLGFDPVATGPLEVGVIGSSFDACRTRRIACLQKEKPSS